MKRLLPLLILCCCAIVALTQNSGVQLDGSSGSITMCDSDEFDIDDGFTIEAWIFASAWRAEAWQGSIVNKDAQGPDSGFGFRAGKNGTLSMVMSVEGTWFEVQTDPFMNALQWYHVAAVVDGTTLSLYINGQLMNSGNFSGTPLGNSQPLTIGASPFYAGRVWDGVIDEVRVWQVARTAVEINDNQTTDLTGTEPGLVAYLPMNEGSGSSAMNLASTCDGSLVGLGSDAWVDGYTIPAIDGGVIRVNAPDVLSIYERPVRVTVTLQNFGTDPLTDIPVELDVNGLPTLSANYEGTIAPGETAQFTFPTPLDLRDNTTNLLSARTADADDANSLNDAGSYRYRRPDDGSVLTILNEEQHNFGSAGQTQFTEMNLPVHNQDYEQMLLHISVECPTAGCDPWDQPASIFVIKDDVEYEIARFITPYGIECGGWVVDVTDFKSLLSGPVVFKSYVQVWGSSGWLVNADLEFVKGDAPSYQRTRTLWQDFNWVYGDPGISYDLEAQTNDVAANTADAHLRMTISGHGQGNTDNAAEFSNKTHSIFVDSELSGNHNLWKADCGANDCSGQAGNWTPSRAGWCPGQQVDPFSFDLGGLFTAGEDLTLDYELEAYTNLLNTDYNDGSHTEPHYRIASFLVEGSNSPYVDRKNLKATSLVLTTNGNPGSPVFESLTLNINNTGTEAVNNPVVSYYVNGTFIMEETVNATIAAGDSYSHDFSSVSGFTAGDDHSVIAVVTTPNDENLSDDAAGVFIDDQLTGTEQLTQEMGRIFPNPSTGTFRVELTDNLLNGTLEVVNVSGQVVQQRKIVALNSQVDITVPGMYLLRLTTVSGQQYFEKIVVQ